MRMVNRKPTLPFVKLLVVKSALRPLEGNATPQNVFITFCKSALKSKKGRFSDRN